MKYKSRKDIEELVRNYIKDVFTVDNELEKVPEQDRRYAVREDDLATLAMHFYIHGVHDEYTNQTMKRNQLFDELVSKVPQEIADAAEKAMSCKWLRNGEECGKGLLGTPCEVVGCVAWEKYEEK